MKTLRPLAAFALLLAAAFALAASARADTLSIAATLVLGSNEGKGIDGGLSRYEEHLKRVFPFDTFTLYGSASGSIASPGSSALNLGQGHSLELTSSEAGGEKVRLAARWSKGGRVLISTTVVASKGQPTVLGGPAQGSGKLILLLVAR